MASAGARYRQIAQDNLPVVHFLVDSALWTLSVPFAVWLRYDFDVDQIGASTLTAIAAAVGLQAIFGVVVGQYRGRWRYGTFDEVVVVALTALAVGICLTLLFWADDGIPRSVPMLATGITLLGQVAVRSFWRLWKTQQHRPVGDEVLRIIVVGAGSAAEPILRTIRDTPDAPYLPVAILDDDPLKQNLRLSGVRVRGRLDDLAAVAKQHHADGVLIAIPSAEPRFMRTVTAAAEAIGLEVFILPPIARMLGGLDVGEIRHIEHADLLGRPPAEIDVDAIAAYVTGRRVLVTGAGGSIGSELCRQLSKFEPSELLMLDRDESGLHGTQLSIDGQAMLDSPNLILADIRDEGRVNEIFESYRPEVVFHTAALKHLPLLETHPDEGWKTNVVGTLHLLKAASATGVERFVNISTDKAANPTSVLGYTKRITERLTAWADTQGDTVFVSVRFGNVLGSNGSVLKAFEAQAEAGGPITVTHPEITRYFMTIEEAARLTVHAAASGRGGELMILDMGDPVRILDVAERFAAHHEPPLEIVFTGLRPNEKMHEDLVSTGEEPLEASDDLIMHVGVPVLEPTVLPSDVSADSYAAIAEWDTGAAEVKL